MEGGEAMLTPPATCPSLHPVPSLGLRTPVWRRPEPRLNERRCPKHMNWNGVRVAASKPPPATVLMGGFLIFREVSIPLHTGRTGMRHSLYGPC